MGFDEMQRVFIDQHMEKRKGERRGRLERGHGHAESLFLRNVWWPVRGHFQHLHPEYEVMDWRGRSYFADFAWLPGNVRLIFEIKGFATHVRDMDRQKYSQELNRETFLYAMGYHVISFAYDDVERNPELCQTMLRMVLSKFESKSGPDFRAHQAEREMIRFAVQQAEPIRPIDAVEHFGVDHKTAVNILQKLCSTGQMLPLYRGKGKRIVRYELTRNFLEYID